MNKSCRFLLLLSNLERVMKRPEGKIQSAHKKMCERTRLEALIKGEFN